MTSSLGTDFSGTRDLLVTFPGKDPIPFENLEPPGEGIRRLDWLGFCSHDQFAYGLRTGWQAS